MAASWPEPDGSLADAHGHHDGRPFLPLTDPRGDVRPLDDIERDTIRFAISHYRGQMSEVARRLESGGRPSIASWKVWAWTRMSRRRSRISVTPNAEIPPGPGV